MCEKQMVAYRENPEAKKAYMAEHYQKNIEVKKAYNVEYYQENREELAASSREYYVDNREQVLESRVKNRPAINQLRKRRYAFDPSFRLACCLRATLAGRSEKSAKTVELLGAPWVWVEAYLEEQFQPGMSWENHGPVWEIDHIRPVSSFDLTDPEQQRMCFHWTNLQPLFTPDNRRKSDTYDPQNA